MRRKFHASHFFSFWSFAVDNDDEKGGNDDDDRPDWGIGVIWCLMHILYWPDILQLCGAYLVLITGHMTCKVWVCSLCLITHDCGCVYLCVCCDTSPSVVLNQEESRWVPSPGDWLREVQLNTHTRNTYMHTCTTDLTRARNIQPPLQQLSVDWNILHH